MWAGTTLFGPQARWPHFITSYTPHPTHGGGYKPPSCPAALGLNQTELDGEPLRGPQAARPCGRPPEPAASVCGPEASVARAAEVAPAAWQPSGAPAAFRAGPVAGESLGKPGQCRGSTCSHAPISSGAPLQKRSCRGRQRVTESSLVHALQPSNSDACKQLKHCPRRHSPSPPPAPTLLPAAGGRQALGHPRGPGPVQPRQRQGLVRRGLCGRWARPLQRRPALAHAGVAAARHAGAACRSVGAACSTAAPAVEASTARHAGLLSKRCQPTANPLQSCLRSRGARR